MRGSSKSLRRREPTLGEVAEVVYVCPICGKRLRGRDELKRHLKRHIAGEAGGR